MKKVLTMKRVHIKHLLVLLLTGIAFSNVIAQIEKKELPSMNSETGMVRIVSENKGESTTWGLNPDLNPDVYTAGLINGKPTTYIYVSDVDSISFEVELGKSYDFVIDWDGKKCYQRFKGVTYVPAANFGKEYQKSRIGKIFVSIPEVYELVNIGIAISRFGKNEKYMVYKRSDYYMQVIDWFDQFSDHRFIQKLDSVFEINRNYYHSYKMNGNAFYFDANGEIKRSTIFDRTGFRDQKDNKLLPFYKEMKDFARVSDFLDFYRENEDTYDSQIRVYKDSIGIRDMQTWLQKQFPGNSAYDTYNIIFSPLVYGNQSSTWFESNGFKELQPHVNFPYRQSLRRLQPISKTAEYVYRGNIVFTELNHGYINPEAEKYSERISKAISNRDLWVEKAKGPDYYAGNSLFNEYMNWILINLRIIDEVPVNEQDELINSVVRMMVKNRGFLKFEEFNQFLSELYRNKAEKTTVADLYPQIITWFEENNES
jgi:hypothetical protein